MGIIRLFFPQLMRDIQQAEREEQGHEQGQGPVQTQTQAQRQGISRMRLSSVLPTKQLALLAFLWAAFYLFFWPLNPLVSLLPFVLMTTKGVDLGVLDGLVLSTLWIIYTLTLASPLYLLLGVVGLPHLRRFLLLSVYLPIIGVVFYKKAHQPASPTFLTLLSVFWDFPLLQWMRLVAYFNGRALKPFYSRITATISMGSMPVLDRDAAFLRRKGVGLVVNMCRESDGLGAYERSGITHLHLPTPDVCEPRYEDILRGVRTIKDFLKSQESERERQSQESEREREREEGESQERSQDGGKGNEAQLDNQQHQHSVFIHCKAGRGRAAAITLCTIFALDPAYPDINSAMKRIL
ncbi:hypothetical protein B484DRAFT_484639, partial [Ochromonadaceae sp. CCMP2298]